jgi:DNA-binding transcriptional regulator GbsR (MarR family)
MPPSQIIESSEYLNLVEKIGSFIEYWGFKQVHGKIWTLVFLSPEPVDANFLKDTLNISKALTSMSLKDLLYYNVIQEVVKDKPGTQKYQINPDITNVILEIINKRELKMLTEIQRDCLSLADTVKRDQEGGVDPKRMEKLTNMVNMAHGLLIGMTSGTSVDFKIFEDVMNVQD